MAFVYIPIEFSYKVFFGVGGCILLKTSCASGVTSFLLTGAKKMCGRCSDLLAYRLLILFQIIVPKIYAVGVDLFIT